MISKPTTLILGAGASVDYDFPLGRDLITAICNGLENSRSDMYKLIVKHKPKSADIHAEIHKFQRHLNNSDLRSIDAFLENRPGFREIGKLAIAAALIPHEKKENLDRSKESLRWYEYLHGILLDGTPRDNFKSNKLSIITFNYDRSFEYSLFLAIRDTYGLTDEECKEYIQAIHIIHVYGHIGEPAWNSKVDGQRGYRSYDPEPTQQAVEDCLTSIRIVHEGMHDSDVQKAQEYNRKAQVVCCLGFGYHPNNIKHLRLQETLPGANKKLYFSIFQLTDRQWEKLELSILPKTRPPGWRARYRVIVGKEDETVLDFLRETAVLE